MKISDLPSSCAILLIYAWRYILRPLFPGNACRFEPSCSHYAEEAVRKHGFLRGSILSLWRLLRCNPWNRGGYDPVKPAKERK